MADAVREIANAFVEARKAGEAISQYPGPAPQDLAEAYAIQDAALSIWQRSVGGWKVGRINPPFEEQLGNNRLAGPVFADLVQTAGDVPSRFPVFADGFAAAEAEFMLRLAPQDGPLPSNAAEAMAWVDEIRVGIEVASSPYPGINADGPCVTISDHGNNAGLLLGPELPREKWAGINDIDITLDIDGEQVGHATAAAMLDGPFGAVCFLLANLAERGITPQAGWWVSSGAVTGVHVIAPGQSAIARFAGVGEVAVAID